MVCSDTLLDIYACAEDPQRWQATLDRMRDFVGVGSAVVQRFRRTGDRIEQVWAARDTHSTHNAALHDRLINNPDNPRINLRIANPLIFDRVIRDEDRFSATPYRVVASFRKRLNKAGLGESIGAVRMIGADEAVAVIFHREAGDTRPFTERDERYMLDHLPHISKAAQLTWQLQRSNLQLQQMRTIADFLNTGIIKLDGGRQVEWTNAAAGRILEQTPCLMVSHGVLRGRSNEDDRALCSLFEAYDEGEAKPAVFGAGEDHELHVMRILDPLCPSQPVLLISEPRRITAPPVEEIAHVLKVTLAEARVSAAICNGTTLKEYAGGRRISEGSARNQLKQVLAKVNVRRQPELIRHLCNSVIYQTYRTGPASRD